MDFGVSLQATKRVVSSPSFLPKILPALLLGGLLLASLITVITQAGRYGIAEDETTQDAYGRAALAFYGTGGRNITFVTGFGAQVSMAEHGVIFDVVIAAAQYALPGVDHWYVRHLITALGGVLGVAIIALAGFELGGYWVAFLAGLGLWLYPRYYGAIYTNSKDVPAAVTLTLVLWAALLLIRQWNNAEHPQRYLRTGVLLGFALGLATAVRVNAILWYVVLAVFLAGWWLAQGRRVRGEGQLRAELLKQAKAMGIVAVTSYITMIILWPYLLLNPVVNLYHAIEVNSHFPWAGAVLYKGMLIPATQLPADYIPTWLIIGSSLTLVALAALGLGVVGVSSARAQALDPKVVIILLSFAIPLLALVGLHAVVYDGLRHFLFLIPPLILLGAYGLVRVVTLLARVERSAQAERSALQVVAAGLIVLTVVSYSLDVREMLALSPFEYAYFSPLIGGIAGANGRYDTDYWSTCNRQAAEWLASNYQSYTQVATPTIQAQPVEGLAAAYLPSAFRQDDIQPDFYIASTRGRNDLRFPSYTIVHIVAADGVPICVVKVNPSLVTS